MVAGRRSGRHPVRQAVALGVQLWRAMTIGRQFKILQLQFGCDFVIVIADHVLAAGFLFQILKHVIPGMIVSNSIARFHVARLRNRLASLKSPQLIQLLLHVDTIGSALRALF